MEHLEFLVEEPSIEEALNFLVPAIRGSDQGFAIHPHQGRHDLLAKLPARLRGYRRWLPSNSGIVVIIDEDRDDCHALKSDLESIAHRAGFTTKTRSPAPGSFQVLNRIAVEELEAWFFGDIAALAAAYPGVPLTLGSRRRFRDPDAIAGGTWEALERVLQAAWHHSGGLQKIRAAREITPHMNLAHNTSRSFQVFRDGLLAM